jgi:S-adenosylmethionine/arginine decarboxylase-like enzyme
MDNKLKLYGFNNLTKALSFNIYDVCYAKSEREQRDYIAYIGEQYNAERLSGILHRLSEMIGAQVLNVSKQDYDPQGSSVTILLAEEAIRALATPCLRIWIKAISPYIPTRSTTLRRALPHSGGYRYGYLRPDHAVAHAGFSHWQL